MVKHLNVQVISEDERKLSIRLPRDGRERRYGREACRKPAHGHGTGDKVFYQQPEIPDIVMRASKKFTYVIVYSDQIFRTTSA